MVFKGGDNVVDVILSVIFSAIAGYIASLFFRLEQLPFMFYVILGFGGTIVGSLLFSLIGFSIGGLLRIVVSIFGSIVLLKFFAKESY